MSDSVEHPSHYTDRVPGIECIDVTKHFDFARGNAIKYIWRAGLKGDRAKEAEDLRKAIEYLQIALRKMNEEVFEETVQYSSNITLAPMPSAFIGHKKTPNP